MNSTPKRLEWKQVQCIICFEPVSWIAINHEDLDVDYFDEELSEFPILCNECQEKTK